MKRGSHGVNGDFMSRRICEETTEKLETSDQSNGRSTKEHEETV